MFDTIGRDLDEQANRRRAMSFVLSLALLSSLVGFGVGLTMYTAAELVLDEGVDEPMFEVALASDEPTPELPALPPPPPPPAAGPEVATDEEVEPDAIPEEVKPLDVTIDDRLKEQARSAGEADGREDGEAGGRDGGVPGGREDGVDGGTGDAGGPRTFHHAELRTRRRVDPEYPSAARELALGEQRCRARVFIDPEGVPTGVEVEGCPKIFHEETARALMRWRWMPPRDPRGKVSAVTTIAIVYRMQ